MVYRPGPVKRVRRFAYGPDGWLTEVTPVTAPAAAPPVRVVRTQPRRQQQGGPAMTTVHIKGQEVRVGDDLWTSGRPHRITRIVPYNHIGVTLGEPWRIAYSDGPDTGGAKAWGITLSYDHGWAAGYEITARPGDTRGEPHQPAGDWLSPTTGKAAASTPPTSSRAG